MHNGLFGSIAGFATAATRLAVLGCGFCALLLSASAADFPTVGVYDETTQTNGVDFVADGSTLDFNQFKADLPVAFSNGFGGVFQCYEVGLDSGPYTFSYGVSHSKRLTMTGANNEIGVTTSTSSIQAISETGLWVSSPPSMTFLLNNVSPGLTNEPVIKFGLTILSDAFYSFDDVTATATFSGGGQAIATRHISEAAGMGDTFFGFEAPKGQSITGVTFTNNLGHIMCFDDIAFITVPIPSLAISQQSPTQVQLSWPTNSIGFTLESATAISGQAWITDTNTPTVIGDRFLLDIDSTVGQRFYRLRGP